MTKATLDPAADERFMRRAIALAEQGLGETNPNPPVGCVLVRRGVVVGEGFHLRAGTPHAEAHALTMAGTKARGATAYVTLEPCAPHEGKRTPPCGPRLVEAGVARVVVGTRDLNPLVRGRGIARLRAAGIEILEGVCATEARRLTQHFNSAMRLKRPFVTLKAGTTLDGRIATALGESKWITSTKQRSVARSMRRLFDGVVVGVETAIQDDPMLVPVPGSGRRTLRVVLDSRLRLPTESRLVRTARRHPLVVVCVQATQSKRRSLEDRGVTVLPVESANGRVSIAAALRALFDQGIRSLVVEGGSEVIGSFIRERLFDEFVLFRAPLILGGRGSRPAVGGDNPVALSEAIHMRVASREDSTTVRYGLSGMGAPEVEVYEPRRLRG